jgi:hypothetical protein
VVVANALQVRAIAHAKIKTDKVDEAFEWLERGYPERDPHMIALESHPGFNPTSMTSSAASGSRRSEGAALFPSPVHTDSRRRRSRCQ